MREPASRRACETVDFDGYVLTPDGVEPTARPRHRSPCLTSEAMAQGIADMMVAKNEGLDNAEPRTPQSATPTSFRQWCEQVLKPAVLA